MRWILLSLTLATVISLSHAQDKDAKKHEDNVPPSGFVALFNGKDTTGWLEGGKPPVHWTVKDGVLAYDGKGRDLFGAEKFSNYVLLVDWKVEKNGNSGVYLRSGNPQAEINDADPANRPIWNGTSGGLYPDKAPLKRAAKPTGEWNHFEITVNRDTITVLTNGEKTIDAFKKDWGKNTSGTIGFQNHGTPVWYKNIFIKKLPD